MRLIATVLKSNNPEYPPGKQVPILEFYSKFESKTFGKYFLIAGTIAPIKCHTIRCDTLWGGSWEITETKEI